MGIPDESTGRRVGTDGPTWCDWTNLYQIENAN